MTNNKVIALAAWLHDIGIFARRAGIEQYVQTVKDCLPDDNDVQKDEVIRLISKWRSPASYDEWLIAHGNRLSRGLERCSLDAETALYHEPLVHLVSTVYIQEEGLKPPAAKMCSLKPLETSAIFPSAAAGAAGRQEYHTLWRQFEEDFRIVKQKGWNYDEYIQSLDTLLERYCWCIPVSPHEQDVSLYQHLKMTAAFAGTLHRYYSGKETETAAALDSNDEAPFLFIQGDVSGIQKYIFDIRITDNNAKLLRARSFQILALGEIIARHLAGSFGLSLENILTSAGGKFLLLAPNTETVKEKLEKLRLDIESFFLKEFAGRLTFALSEGVPASGKDVQKGSLQNLLNRIGSCGETAKQKKMQRVLEEHGHVLEELYNGLQQHGDCKWCEALPGVPGGADKKAICKNCSDLIEIGGKLVKASKITFITDKLATFNDMVKIDSGQFGSYNEYKPGFPMMPLPYAVPLENGRVCTFEDIAEKSEGTAKLAMFKADIDNLGLIFASPWGDKTKDKASFSLHAQLSRRLHYFFSAFISDYIEEHYGKKIYTVFSGGDDLCVLGAWNTVMHFAADFRERFAAFTGNNPSVTLSGGIALADPKLPVRAIAAMAEEALEEAKDRRDNRNEKTIIKNGVSIFGVTVGWDEPKPSDETKTEAPSYRKSLGDALEIKQYLDEKAVSSALVYKMIDFANRAQRVKKDGSLRDLLWMSNYRYVIARNINMKHKDAAKALKFFHQFGVNPDAMGKSRIAVSYALYISRKGKGEKDVQ